MSLRTLVVAGMAFAMLTACASYTPEQLAARDPETGYFLVGCGFFGPYNENMTTRTLDGRFPGGGGESAAIMRGSEGSPPDTDCGMW